MFIECSLIGNELHSHTYYSNTHLFKNFIANFIADSPQTESKQKDDFIEEWGYNGFMKTLGSIGIGIIGLLGSGLWLWTYRDIGVPLNEAFDLTIIAWYISSSILLFGILNKEDSSLRFCITFSVVWSCIWAALHFALIYDNSYISLGLKIFSIIFTLQPIIWFVFLHPNRK